MTGKFCRFYNCSLFDVWKMPYKLFFAYFREIIKIKQEDKK